MQHKDNGIPIVSCDRSDDIRALGDWQLVDYLPRRQCNRVRKRQDIIDSSLPLHVVYNWMKTQSFLTMNVYIKAWTGGVLVLVRRTLVTAVR